MRHLGVRALFIVGLIIIIVGGLGLGLGWRMIGVRLHDDAVQKMTQRLLHSRGHVIHPDGLLLDPDLAPFAPAEEPRRGLEALLPA